MTGVKDKIGILLYLLSLKSGGDKSFTVNNFDYGHSFILMGNFVAFVKIHFGVILKVIKI